MAVPNADVFSALLDLEHAANAYQQLAHSFRPGFPERLDPALQRSLRQTGDAASTLHALKDLEDRLVALEDRIRSTRNIHRLARTTLENYMTPIAVLPTEILLQIFSFAASGNDMSMFWTSQSCRQWRSIVIRQPDLWMFPPTGCKAPILQLYVDRSGRHPLDLKLDGNRARWARVKSIVSAIAPRLRLLEWSSSAGDVADPDVALDPVEDSEDALDEIESMQWPILEVLHLRHNVARRPHSFREYDVLQARLPRPTSVPVLRELQLQGMLVWRSLEAFPSLRSLCVRRFTPSRAFIVQYLPSLQVEKLHLESGIGRVWSTGILVPIALHRLKALHLMDCGLEIMSYFASRASFPELTKMVLVDRASSLALGWDPDDAAKLASLPRNLLEMWSFSFILASDSFHRYSHAASAVLSSHATGQHFKVLVPTS